jgi:hypothetical protein
MLLRSVPSMGIASAASDFFLPSTGSRIALGSECTGIMLAVKYVASDRKCEHNQPACLTGAALNDDKGSSHVAKREGGPSSRGQTTKGGHLHRRLGEG